jgi:hypothetical protein
MSKVKLILDKGDLDYGEVTDVVLTLQEGHRVRGVVETGFEPQIDGSVRSSDGIDTVIYIEDINNLVGRIKTLLDASISDPEQRKASKDVFNNEIWSWYTGRLDNLSRTWRFDKGYESKVAIK